MLDQGPEKKRTWSEFFAKQLVQYDLKHLALLAAVVASVSAHQKEKGQNDPLRAAIKSFQQHQAKMSFSTINIAMDSITTHAGLPITDMVITDGKITLLDKNGGEMSFHTDDMILTNCKNVSIVNHSRFAHIRFDGSCDNITLSNPDKAWLRVDASEDVHINVMNSSITEEDRKALRKTLHKHVKFLVETNLHYNRPITMESMKDWANDPKAENLLNEYVGVLSTDLEVPSVGINFDYWQEIKPMFLPEVRIGDETLKEVLEAELKAYVNSEEFAQYFKKQQVLTNKKYEDQGRNTPQTSVQLDEPREQLSASPPVDVDKLVNTLLDALKNPETSPEVIHGLVERMDEVVAALLDGVFVDAEDASKQQEATRKIQSIAEAIIGSELFQQSISEKFMEKFLEEIQTLLENDSLPGDVKRMLEEVKGQLDSHLHPENQEFIPDHRNITHAPSLELDVDQIRKRGCEVKTPTV